MAKSLFDIENKIKQTIPSLLPTDTIEDIKNDNEINTCPLSDNPPQIFTNTEIPVKITNTEKPIPITNTEIPAQMSGAFFIRGEELIADIRLEFDVRHPLYNLYINRLKDLVQECEKVHVLKSSSGL